MKTISNFIVVAITCVTLSACFPMTKSYVDPQYRRASYEQVQRPSQPTPVKVDVQFQRNGQALPAVDAELRDAVERTLRATGVFVPSPDSDGSTVMSVVANNIADIAAARAKGFGTGLTFGAVGSVVDDNYEFNLSYRDAEGREQKATYQHVIHSTVGRAAGPEGMEPTTPAAAFAKVIEDVILNFVKDLQDKKLALE